MLVTNELNMIPLKIKINQGINKINDSYNKNK